MSASLQPSDPNTVFAVRHTNGEYPPPFIPILARLAAVFLRQHTLATAHAASLHHNPTASPTHIRLTSLTDNALQYPIRASSTADLRNSPSLLQKTTTLSQDPTHRRTAPTQLMPIAPFNLNKPSLVTKHHPLVTGHRSSRETCCHCRNSMQSRSRWAKKKSALRL